MLRRLMDYLWSLLPDKCEVPGCRRNGTRGNENRVEGFVVCDYCHAEAVARRITISELVRARRRGRSD